jgi:TonB-dependent starch-binding outer membrane protein SusC
MTLRRYVLSALATGLLWAVPLSAQTATGTINGRVVDGATMQPLAGANITIEGTQRGTITRADGAYILTAVPAGTHRVRASLIGYSGQSQDVTVAAGGSATVQFTLQPQAVLLEGIVAVGYGQRRARDVAGSVQAVNSEQFNTGRIISPEQLIQAKVPGVQMVTSGEPGGGTGIRIRGGTSVNASNDPLFVIDGIPLAPGGGLSSGRNPLNFLNPEDIESITVLKDAASTAIYGSRGANGVVLVTTKTGRSRGPQVAYNGSMSSSRNLANADMMNADEFRRAVTEHSPNNVGLLGSASTDWREAVLRDGRGQEHSLAFSGAVDQMSYRLSLGYLGQEGVLQGSRTERVSGSLNYNHSLFNDWLNITGNLRGARTDDDYTPGGGIGAANAWDPTHPVRTELGFYERPRTMALAPNNPVAELGLGIVEGTTFRAIANLEGRLRLPFVQGLSATTRVGYDAAESERRTFSPSTMWAQQKSDRPGYVSRSNPAEQTALLETFVNFNNRFDAFNSDVDATAGYSYERSHGAYPFFEAIGLSTDLLGATGLPTARETISRLSERENRLASFFGRVNYTLMDRYLLTLSVRRDGSSRFGPDNQWATFPAASVAWRLSDEPFLAGYPILSDLKLRASWGVNGNQAIGDYLWAASYRYSDERARVQFGDEWIPTIRPNAVDPNIKWEETTSYNLGIDYGFLENRITGSLEYYVKDTDDLIFRVPVAAGTFLSNRVTTNVGSVRNQGVEAMISADVLPRRGNGLSWTASFNAARNSNELLQISPIGGGTEQILVGGISGGVGSNIQVLRAGHPVNSFFVYQHKRDANGRPVVSENLIDMYVDQNGDGIINQNDRTVSQSPAPNWIFGHTSQLSYGNLDVSTTVRANLGNYVYNNLASSAGYYNRLGEAGGPFNLHRSVMQNGFRSAQFFSDVYVEDASFLRMDNLTVGYTLPRLAGMQRMRVFGTVQNAFTLTGYSGVDPEAGLGGIDNNLYPRSRTFTVGANVGF